MSEQENWTLTIESKPKLFDIRLRELIQYKDLIFLLVKRDFVTQYKQTILGPLWFVINPLISTAMYTFIFGRLANISTDGIPHTLFYYSGTMMWIFFTGCFMDSVNVFANNAHLFGKVYFPRLAIPINNVLSNSIKISVQFVLLIGFLIYYLIVGFPLSPSINMILFPLLVLWLAAIGVGAGIIISSITTKYRDLRNLVTFALNLAMYATPVVFPLSEIPERFSWVAYVNPVCAPIELFRLWFFGAASVEMTVIVSSLLFTLVLLFVGLILFNRNEKTFIDVL